jgi:hypothetical protein
VHVVVARYNEVHANIDDDDDNGSNDDDDDDPVATTLVTHHDLKLQYEFEHEFEPADQLIDTGDEVKVENMNDDGVLAMIKATDDAGLLE